MDIQKSAADWKKEGNEAFSKENFHKAIQCYTMAIKLDQSDHSYYSNRAICYFNIGKYLDCINDCDACLKIKPDFVKAIRRKGIAYVHLLKFQQAIYTYKTALEFTKDQGVKNQLEDAEHYLSNYTRFKAAVQRENFEQALSCINFLVLKISTSDALKLHKVQCLAKNGNTSDALTLLKSIQSATMQHPDLWYLKGIIELYGGESGRAKKFFMEGMRLDPDNNKCRLALNKAKQCEKLKQQGNQFIKNAKFEQAQLKYTEAIQLDPFNKKLNAVIYSNRALTFMKRKQLLKALDDLNKSLELNPEYTKSLIRRAEVQMEKKQYTAAIMDYNKIQQLDPSADMRKQIKEAQSKERQAKKKDYYKILGLERNATETQIKKAYKSLAMKHHPDRNRTKSEAQQQQASKMFKEVAEAYGVLSDPKKKQLYDSGQMEFDGDQGSGFGGMGGGVDPTEIFQMFFGGMGGGMGGMGGMGGGRKKGGMNFQDFGSFGGGNGKTSYTFRMG